MGEREKTFQKFFSSHDPAGTADFGARMRDRAVVWRDGLTPEMELPWGELTAEERGFIALLKLPRKFKDLEGNACLEPEKALSLMRALHAAELLDTAEGNKARALVPVEVRKAVAEAKGQQLVRKKLHANVYRPPLEGEQAAGGGDGQFEYVEQMPVSSAASAPSPAPPPPPPPPPPQASTELKAFKEEIEKVHATLSKTDHFALLGIKREAAESDVKTAYFALAKKYHPDRLAGAAPDEVDVLKPKLEAIFSAVGDAYRTLQDKKLRESYLEDLKKRELSTAEGAAPKARPRRAEEAKMHAQKGKIFMGKKEFADAEAEYAKAKDLDPDLAEYRTEYAWALSLNPRRPEGERRAKAVAELKSLTANVKYADAFYKLGLLQRANGDVVRAEESIRQAYKIDSKHADAAREVRVYDMRAEKAKQAVEEARNKPAGGILDIFKKK
ncbi:MAG: DnaJ domain-containing protein [Myxococcota bacterium]